MARPHASIPLPRGITIEAPGEIANVWKRNSREWRPSASGRELPLRDCGIHGALLVARSRDPLPEMRGVRCPTSVPWWAPETHFYKPARARPHPTCKPSPPKIGGNARETDTSTPSWFVLVFASSLTHPWNEKSAYPPEWPTDMMRSTSISRRRARDPARLYSRSSPRDEATGLSAWTSRLPACSRRAWWCTRPIRRPMGPTSRRLK